MQTPLTHLILFPLNILLMFAVALGLGYYLIRRFKLGWGIFFAGGLTFILSQVVRLPLLSLLTWLFQQGYLPAPPAEWSFWFNIFVLSLSAGIFEESARLVAFNWYSRNARDWQRGVLFGAGHGGVEAMLVGGAALLTFINMIILSDPAFLETTMASLDAEAATTLTAQMEAYWGAPVWLILFGALERFLVIPIHIAMTILVLWTVVKRTPWGYIGAIAMHFVLNFGSVSLLQITPPEVNVFLSEGFVAVVTVLALVWLRWSRPHLQELAQSQTQQDAEPVELLTLERVADEDENLDTSRFSG